MKAIFNIHGNWAQGGYEFPTLGKMIKEVDESRPYEQDGAMLFKNQRKYTLLSATGCSCWDGDWEGWTDLTKTELKKVAKGWAESKGYVASEKTIGNWILENAGDF